MAATISADEAAARAVERQRKLAREHLGGTVLPGPPEAFGQLIADETEKWAKVVRFSGAKVE